MTFDLVRLAALAVGFFTNPERPRTVAEEDALHGKLLALWRAEEDLDILGKLHPEEPVFVLRAQDRSAPGLVQAWADHAAHAGSPLPKVAEARRVAQAMEDWQDRNRRFVKQPD